MIFQKLKVLKDLVVLGAINVGKLAITKTLVVAGAVTAATTLAVTGAVTLASTLAVTGASTFTGAVTCNGGATINDLLTLTPRADAPGTPAEGMVYADSAAHTVKFYNGTAWYTLDMTIVT